MTVDPTAMASRSYPAASALRRAGALTRARLESVGKKHSAANRKGSKWLRGTLTECSEGGAQQGTAPIFEPTSSAGFPGAREAAWIAARCPGSASPMPFSRDRGGPADLPLAAGALLIADRLDVR